MKKARLIFMTTGCILCFVLAVFISVEAFGATVTMATSERVLLDDSDDDNQFSQPAPPVVIEEEGDALQPLELNSSGGMGLSSEVTAPHNRRRRERPSDRPDFSLRRENFNGAGRVRKGYRWNGCSKTAEVRGGFGSNNRCANNSKTIFSRDFATHLNKKFMSCIRSAAKTAGLNRPKNVFLNLGTVRENRRRHTPGGSNKWSNHAYGRALDIFAFNLYDSKGRRTYIKAHRNSYGGQNRLFYNKFVVCWKTSVRRRCRTGNGAIIHTKADAVLTRQGHRFYSNSLHANHIHLEFPNNCRSR